MTRCSGRARALIGPSILVVLPSETLPEAFARSQKQGSPSCGGGAHRWAHSWAPLSRFSIFFDFFFKGIFFSKEKIIFSKVVRLTKKMISILTLSRKRKFRFFRDPNCGPTVGCGPNTLKNPGFTDTSTINCTKSTGFSGLCSVSNSLKFCI